MSKRIASKRCGFIESSMYEMGNASWYLVRSDVLSSLPIRAPGWVRLPFKHVLCGNGVLHTDWRHGVFTLIQLSKTSFLLRY